jgi:hypothetical protein
MNKLIAPVGIIEQDSINISNVRSREYVDPKTDLAFYFNEYIVPKYGLNNINVSNCASFMKDLEMNWSKLDAGLKDKVLSILVDNIFTQNYDFRSALMAKLNIQQTQFPQGVPASTTGVNNVAPAPEELLKPAQPTTPTETVTQQFTSSKESFGTSENNNIALFLIIGVFVLLLIVFFADRLFKTPKGSYPY